MKTILTLIAAFGLASITMAQVETPDTTATQNEEITAPKTGSVDDTTRIDLKNAKITIVSKTKAEKDAEKESSSKYDLTWWDGIDIGVNGIMGDDYRTELDPDYDYLEPDYGKSRYIAFNFGQLKGRLIKDYVGITTGLGVQFYNFKYDGDTEFIFGDSLHGIATGDKNVSKNKVRATYVAVPVLLEFNTSLDPKKSFHISAGIVGKVRIENMYKQIYSLDGSDTKLTQKNDLGFNRWGADAIVRVGYRKLTFFTQVGLLPLFEENENNPELYAFAAGLNLNF